MHLNQRIKELRLLNHLTQEELAAKIGVQKPTIQRYESGKIPNIPYDNVIALAVALGCTPTYLMGWERDNSPNLTPEESCLITDYRSLNDSGRQYILHTMSMVKETHKKTTGQSTAI